MNPLALLKLVPLRWWLYLAAAGAIGFLLLHDHHATQRGNREAAARAVAETQAKRYADTIEIMTVDAALNQETSRALYERLGDIEPRRTFSVRCQPATAAVPAEGATASGADAAPERGGTEAPLRDIGAALEDARIEAQGNNAQFMTLQEFEVARTH